VGPHFPKLRPVVSEPASLRSASTSSGNLVPFGDRWVFARPTGPREHEYDPTLVPFRDDVDAIVFALRRPQRDRRQFQPDQMAGDAVVLRDRKARG